MELIKVLITKSVEVAGEPKFNEGETVAVCSAIGHLLIERGYAQFVPNKEEEKKSKKADKAQ